MVDLSLEIYFALGHVKTWRQGLLSFFGHGFIKIVIKRSTLPFRATGKHGRGKATSLEGHVFDEALIESDKVIAAAGLHCMILVAATPSGLKIQKLDHRGVVAAIRLLDWQLCCAARGLFA